jgi:transposase, IS5 family
MLRDRYRPIDLFALVPQLGLHFEPQLAQLDRLLDDDQLFAAVRADLARRHPLTRTHGRPSTPVEVILRMLVVMRLYGWSFAQAEYFVNDSLVLRQFCRAYLHRVPDDTTLIRWARLVGPETLQRLNDRAVQLAKRLKVTRGRRLRVDTTAVEADIHYPTDSALIGDGVRVLSRLLRRAKGALGAAAAGLGREAFRSRVRSVRRLSRELHGIARRRGTDCREALKAAYSRLIGTAKRTAGQAKRVLGALRSTSGPENLRLAGRVEEFLPRLAQGIRQAWRRVINGEAVPAKEKLLSVFEPHAQVVPRHKAGREVEFGRKLRLDEVEGGIVSGYRVLEQGGGQDYPHLADSLATHRRLFGRAPRLLAADRGFSSPRNEALAKEAGVKRVCLPHAGRAPPGQRRVETERWFRRGYRFRAGIEGRVHALRRDFGLRRCRFRGATGMGRWVGWGVLTHNLDKIAGAVAARHAG